MNELISLIIPIVGPFLGVSRVSLRGVNGCRSQKELGRQSPPPASLRGERALSRLGPLCDVAVNGLERSLGLWLAPGIAGSGRFATRLHLRTLSPSYQSPRETVSRS